MLSLYRTLSLRYLSRRRGRAVLVIASIMLGVATLVATQALGETMSKATLASSNPMAGTIDLIVTNGEFPIDRALGKDIQTVKGVKAVQPRIFDHAKWLVGDQKQPVMIMGYDVTGAKQQTDDFENLFTISPGINTVKAAYVAASIGGYIPAVVGKELDEAMENEKVPAIFGFKVFTLEKNLKKHELMRVAMVEPKEAGDWSALGGHVIMLDLDNAAKVLGLPKGKVRRIDVALDPGTDPKVARSAIERRLAGRAEVRTIAEQNQSLQSAMVGMKTGFSMCGIAALIVGMFLVYNSLSVSVAERRHEIGILLALGATRDQVWRLFAGEACFLGTLGAALGIPLGLGLAYLSLKPIQHAVADIFSTMNMRMVELTWELTALSFAVGILSALVASMVPAIQAAYDKPAEAVRRVPKEPPMSRLVLHIAATLVLVLSGVSMILVRELIPKRWGSYGGLSLVMIGALLTAPLFAQLAAKLMVPMTRRFFSIQWRLAADNLIRAPGRTGMVIGALAAGVCLFVETTGIIRSNRLAISEWVDTSISADLIITSGSPVGSGGQNTPMDVSLADELRKLPEVEEVMPIRMYNEIYFRKDCVAILTTDAALTYAIETRRRTKRDGLELFKAMAAERDAVIISGNFAALHHVHKGDHITLKSANGEVKLHVIGTITDYSWNLGTILMNRRDYIAHWHDTSVSVFDVYLREGVDAKAAKALISAKLGAQHDLHPLTRVELKSHIDRMIERIHSIAYAQEIIVMIVAVLGVVMALLISVLQRRREMGLLRAIGASQAQVVSLVLAEASLMGLVGAVLGAVFAIPLQWYALQIIFLEEAGYVFPVYVPWFEAAGFVVMAVVVATLAGVGPALYAVRERIPDAIAYE